MNPKTHDVLPVFPRTFVIEKDGIPGLSVSLKRLGIDLTVGLVTALYQNFGLVGDYQKSTGRIRVTGVCHGMSTEDHLSGISIIRNHALEGVAVVWSRVKEDVTRIVVENNVTWNAVGSVRYENKEDYV